MEKENDMNINNNRGQRNQHILEFSPPRFNINGAADSKKSNPVAVVHNDIPTLSCSKFQQPLIIDFGSVNIKITHVTQFRLFNPSKNKFVSVSIENPSLDNGILIVVPNQELNSVRIEPLQFETVSISWTPIKDISMREILKLKLNNTTPMQVTMYGEAGTVKELINIKKMNDLKPVAHNHGKKPQNKLGFSSANQSEFKTSSALATKNHKVLNDTNHSNPSIVESYVWVARQQKNFCDWINFIFSSGMVPISEIVSHDSDNSEGGGAASLHDGEFRTLEFNRMQERIRSRGRELFRSDGIMNTLLSITNEVQLDRIALRNDRDILADIGIQDCFFSLIFNYDTPWLILGLETILNIKIDTLFSKSKKRMMMSNGDTKSRLHLKSLITELLFFDPATTQEYNKEQKILYLSQQEDMKALIRKQFLIKFLSIVLFLDCARRNKLLPSSKLFIKSSGCKSSKDILFGFCRDFLHGEGNVIRHLSFIGYTVHYQQNYMDEYDYVMQDVSTDLRDGVKLVRLYELIHNVEGMSCQLRVPAISRLQKIFNVELILHRLYLGNESRPDAKLIVDGNMEATFALLWKLMLNADVYSLLTSDRILKEILSIQENAKLVTNQGEEQSLDVFNAVMEESLPLESSLLVWIQCIVAKQGITVKSLTSDLLDGRVFCLLIHHYHPKLINPDLIKVGGIGKKHDENFYSNMLLLKRACDCIGGIPFLPTNFNALHVDPAVYQKYIINFLVYLFNRLVESSQEIKSAVLIQSICRRNLVKWRQERLKRANDTLSKGKMIAKSKSYLTISRQKTSNAHSSKVVGSAPSSPNPKDIRRRLNKSHSVCGFSVPFSKVMISRKQAALTIQRCYRLKQAKQCKFVSNDSNIENLLSSPGSSMVSIHDSHLKSNESICYYASGDVMQVDDSINQNIVYPLGVSDSPPSNELPECDFMLPQQLRKLGSSFGMNMESDDEEHADQDILPIGFCDSRMSSPSEFLKIDINCDETFDPYEPPFLFDNASEYSIEMPSDQQMCEKSPYTEDTVDSKGTGFEYARLTNEINDMKILEEKLRAAIEMRLLQDNDCVDNIEVPEGCIATLAESKLIDSENNVKILEANRDEMYALIKQTEIELKRLEVLLEQERESNERNQNKFKEEVDERVAEEHAARLRVEHEVHNEREARLRAESQVIHESSIRQVLEDRLRLLEEEQQFELNRLNHERLLQTQLVERQLTSAEKIQKRWRQWNGFQKHQKRQDSCVKLQSWLRMIMTRNHYQCGLLAVILLQSFWRRKKCVLVLNRMNRICTKIQSFYRRRAAIQKYHRIHHSIHLIRCAWKKYQKACQSRMMHRMASKLQYWWEAKVVIQKYHDMLVKIRRIQCWYRSVKGQQRMEMMRKAVKRIQLCWRRFVIRSRIAMRQSHEMELQTQWQLVHQVKRKVCGRKVGLFVFSMIHNFKMKQSVAKISRWYQSLQPLRRVRKLIKGFTRLVATFKAKSIRKLSNASIRKALHRIKIAEQKAIHDPTLKLGKRTSDALHVLQTGKMISHILKACQTLEFSTQLSIHCCEAFACTGASDVLFGLLRSCNRSTPHQELLRMALVVLLNVARHNHLAVIVSKSNDATDSLVDLMQMFRDKKSIFMLSCELLNRLVSANPEVKNKCNTPVYWKRLEGIIHILERKHKLETKIRNVSGGDMNNRSSSSGSNQKEVEDGFAKYSKKTYHSVEPITCINHLMELLEHDNL